MTARQADPGSPARRSKITPERAQEFYDAALDQLRESGYEALTMEGVAARSRCGKSTLYRQWGTKQRLVAAALRASRCARFAAVDTGTLAGDLRAVARAAGERSGLDSRLLLAVSHAAMQDEELRQALREALVEPEVAAVDAMLDRAVARGEIPAGHPAAPFVAAQIFGALRALPILEGRYADVEYMTRYVEACVLPALGLTEAT